MNQTIAYLKTLALAQALWWFIENVTEEDANRSEIFFYLRERARAES